MRTRVIAILVAAAAIFGALLNVRTRLATFGLWVYDSNDVVNTSGFEDPFDDGVILPGCAQWFGFDRYRSFTIGTRVAARLSGERGLR